MKNFTLLAFLLSSIFSFGQTWEQIGPSGGYFKEFTFSPSNPAIVYAGSDDGGGVWKSTNGGQDWNLITSDFPNMTGWSITLDESNPDTIYVCDVYGRYGLLKSTDGGVNWDQITTGLSTQYDRMVSGITLKDSDTLFISTGEGASTTPPRPGNGVFKSFDGGLTWTEAGLQGTTVLSIGSNVFGTIFAGTELSGLHFTNDNGTTWTPHPEVDPLAVVYEIEVQDEVIAVSSSSGVYLSTNWGINFTNTGLAGEFNFDVAIRQISPSIELFTTTFSGLQRYSSVNGLWFPVTDHLLDNLLPIGIGASGSNLMVGTFSNGPILTSSDAGLTWATTATSPICTEINDLVVDPTNPDRIVTALLGTYNIGGNYNDQCLYETSNGGFSWNRLGPKAHALCLQAAPFDFNTMYLGTFSQGLFKSTDGFANHQQILSGNKLIGDIAISSEDTSVLLISEIDLDSVPIQPSIKRSTDGGNSFSTVSNETANRIVFNTNDNNTAYAATTNGVVRSVDNGLTWQSWQLSGSNVLSLAYLNNALYAGTSNGELFIVSDSLVSDITGNWSVPVQIKSISDISGQLYVGLNGAEQDTTYVLNGSIWTSPDNGNTWLDMTVNMSSTNVYGNNVIARAGPELVAATYGGGIFKTIGLTINTEELSSIKGGVEVYPNPSSDHVTIRSTDAEIHAYALVDLKGRKLKTDNNLGENVHEINLNISDLETGIYTLILWSGADEILVRKVSIL